VSDLTGELIDGRYELSRLIASGGMASIYAATDLRLDRQVAVKIMHPHLAQDEQFVARFIREAKAAAALTHPNIVAVQDQGWNQNGSPAVFIVMELVEGHTLRDYLYEQGSLSPQQALPIIIPVLSALAAAHKIGIVHRDIKPENILIAKDGRIKIADFGLARGALLGTTMTAESSVILGSVSYLSPEQVQRGVADSRSDVYAVGIVLFEILTGQKPFAGEDPIQIAFKHVNERVPKVSSLLPGIAPELDDLIFRATSVNPDQRPRDAEEFLSSLRSIAEKLDPKRRQLSLELDLPPAPIAPVKERRKRQMPQSMQNLISKTEQIVTPKKEKSLPSSSEQIRIKRKLSKRVKRNRLIATGILAILIFAGWSIFVGPGARVVVPSVAGLTVKSATKEFTSLGLVTEIKEEVFSEDVAAGKIISSNPAGGGKVKEGGTVTLTVSKGKERYAVPSLTGLKPDVAAKQLTDGNLVLGTQSESYSLDIPQGLIISSSPKAGEQVKKDTRVDIVVSKGVEQINANSYVGRSGEQALNELSDAGFDVSPEYVFSEKEMKGIVISQKPDGSQSLPKGSTITLVISKGSEFVSVPNVQNKTAAEATRDLQNSDLKVIVKKIGTKKVKTVTNISPKAGTKVKRGSTVTITVG
jgi:serine/threonine protein kinase